MIQSPLLTCVLLHLSFFLVLDLPLFRADIGQAAFASLKVGLVAATKLDRETSLLIPICVDLLWLNLILDSEIGRPLALIDIGVTDLASSYILTLILGCGGSWH